MDDDDIRVELMGVGLAHHSFIASDGYTSVAGHSNEEAIDRLFECGILDRLRAEAWDVGRRAAYEEFAKDPRGLWFTATNPYKAVSASPGLETE